MMMLALQNKIGAAIDLYTEAITLCPTWPVPLVNRALCHKKNEDWERVMEDCEKVIQVRSRDREWVEATPTFTA